MPEWFEEVEPCIHSSGTEPGCVSCLAGRLHRAEKLLTEVADHFDPEGLLGVNNPRGWYDILESLQPYRSDNK